MKIGAKVRISHPQALDKSRTTALVENPRCEQQLPVRRLGGLGEFVVAKNPENQQTDPQVSAQESPCRHLDLDLDLESIEEGRSIMSDNAQIQATREEVSIVLALKLLYFLV